MHTEQTRFAPELLKQATDLVVRMNAASVSLLQRHLSLSYSAGVDLAQILENAGVITPAGLDGYRALTPFAMSLRPSAPQPTVRELCEAWASDPFEGGDGGDIGSPDMPSIWLYGQEHGDALNIEPEPQTSRDERDYSIDKQLRYPFNRNAFKLFTALHGEPVTQYEQFARRHEPWVPGTKGYFKGNLYPYPCRNLTNWSEQAIKETGFGRKEEFIDWCNENRLPAIADAVKRYRPRLFIGVGANMAREFSLAYFGAALPLESYQFAVGGYTKKILYATHNNGRLVILPHISSGSNGLNSDDALQIAGSFIAGLMR
jgi:hypothetical protein